MTSSTSSSGRSAVAGLAAALAVAGTAGCAHRARERPAATPSPPVALFPIVNLAGAGVPVREIQGALDRALRARGLDLVPDDRVSAFLARHRVRYTGGVDGPTAAAVRQELGAEAILLGSVDLYAALGTPRYAATLRLVSASEEPEIRWMDGAALGAEDHPGFLDLGVLASVQEVEDRVLSRLASSLERHLAGKGGATPCAIGRAASPRVYYRTSTPLGPARPRVAVLPFANESARREAGEVVALQLVRNLSAARGLRILEPGVVRATLLRSRVIMEGGLTHEAARVAFGALDADVVVSGDVHVYDDARVPVLEFSVVALSTRDNRPVWQSTSFVRGDDGVLFFDVGRVSTANALSCEATRTVGQGIADALRPAAVRQIAAPEGGATGRGPGP